MYGRDTERTREGTPGDAGIEVCGDSSLRGPTSEFVLDTDWLFRVAGLVRWTWEARLSRLGRRPGEKERSQANPGDFTADYRRHKG